MIDTVFCHHQLNHAKWLTLHLQAMIVFHHQKLISYATVLCKRTLTSWQLRPHAPASKAADSCYRAGAESGVSGAQDVTCLYCTRGLSVTASTSCRAGASTMSVCWQSLHQPTMLTVTAAPFKVELQAPCISMSQTEHMLSPLR